MRFKIFILCLFYFLGLYSELCFAEKIKDSRGDIILKIDKLKDTKGFLGILIFDQKDGFPSKIDSAYYKYITTFTVTDPRLVLKDFSYGTYAVTVMHDENMNKKLDSNWIGIPREGVGISNNAKGRMGPPKFKDAKFELDKSSITLNIEVKYLSK